MLINKIKQRFFKLHSRTKKKTSGRNNTGRITVAHRGGGHKRKYMLIHRKPRFPEGYVIRFDYDPNRSTRAALVKLTQPSNTNHTFGYPYVYITATAGLNIWDRISNSVLTYHYIKNLKQNNSKILNSSDANFSLNLENTTPQIAKEVPVQGGNFLLRDFNVGDFVHNIEAFPGKGAQLIRAAGTFGKIIQKQDDFVIIELPSGQYRKISSLCKGFAGKCSNENNINISWKKAGKSRWKGIRPTVRGVAKNPIDHPHGGNTSGGCHPVTPWGRLTKGKPTRSKKKKSYIVSKIKF